MNLHTAILIYLTFLTYLNSWVTLDKMDNIPIFDSLTHPMPNGKWLHPKYGNQNTVENLLTDMKRSRVFWALAVGLGEQLGEYSDESYSKFIYDRSENLFPVAFLNLQNFTSIRQLEEHLNYLRKQKYVGIKIHPRLSKISYSHPYLKEVVSIGNSIDLKVLLCTYFHWSFSDNTFCDLNTLISFLSTIPNEKIILVHGGTIELLRLSEAIKPFSNVLLDLSMTLCKYEGSSLDLDLQYLFKSFDERICIGSDSPEFTSGDLRRRFNYFVHNISREKAENIAYKNLARFLDLDKIYLQTFEEALI